MLRDTIEEGVASVVVFLLGLGAWVLSLCASGFVTYSLWGWFLVPLGVPALQGYAHALGIGVFVTYLTIRLDCKTEGTTWGHKMLVWAMWYTFIWCFGWVLKEIMA
jgi:hypothetical protein